MPSWTPKGENFSLKTFKASAVKYLIQKPFLLNFVNLFTNFRPGFSFTWFRSLQFTFPENFNISKDPFAFQIDI